ncbi:MAG TPA: phosphatidylserine decarboxylase [Candidatus Polarisedimenticolaceae bacterium]|nr:phosphatidylserine decarboxylase [Candidatus Polarisedimenticolaceae bacterium]
MKLDPAGRPFVLALAAVTLAASFWSLLAALATGALLVFCINFFRDPERAVPVEAGLLVSPADGRIIRTDATRISIFMNVFDVHVCRAPASGTVAEVERTPGRFLAAMKDDASEHNERTSIVVEGDGIRFRFTLVAGLIARRIVCRVAPGQTVARGERVGIIRFGSRVDVDLPDGATALVAIGDRVVSGESVLARLGPGPGQS